MVGLHGVAAETDPEARRLFTSQQLAFINLLRNRLGPLPPPVDDIEAHGSVAERQQVQRMLSCAVVGARGAGLTLAGPRRGSRPRAARSGVDIRGR